jgi:N-acetylmuramoyl-L-alanine amidase
MSYCGCRFSQQLKRSLRFILIWTGLFLFIPYLVKADGDPDLKNKVHVVVIDAGHGGKDPGAMGSFTREKDIVLKVALKLGKYIEDSCKDVKVIYTRDGDNFVPLYDRADIANKANADLFISIHANYSDKKNAYGTETYVMGEHKNQSNFEVAQAENNVITLEDDYNTKYEGFDPNSIESYIIFSLMQRTYLNQSVDFAGKIQKQFREKAVRVDRGVMQAGFLVLWRTTMPSVLVELGFISHAAEEKYLSSDSGQDYLAYSIFNAFLDYKSEIEKSSNFERKPDPDETYFKLQIFTSRNNLSIDDPLLKDLNDIESFKSGKIFKYAVGRFSTYEQAGKQLVKIKEKYPDAFIIAVKSGQIIPLKEVIHKN